MRTANKTFTIGGDLEVNRLGFGAMRLTGKGIWGEPKDPAEAKRVLKRAVERGVNFIDTADSYGPAVSERLIGEALAPFPQGLVVATKAGFTRQGPDRWHRSLAVASNRPPSSGGGITGADGEAAEAGQDSTCWPERGEAEGNRSGA